MSYTEVIETSDDGRFRVVVSYDTDCESPIDAGDCWVTSVLTLEHSRWGSTWRAAYDPESRLDMLSRLDDSYLVGTLFEPDEAFIRYMRIFHGIEVVETGWGSDGTRALAWVEPSEAERVGMPAGMAAENIKNEVNEYNAWARGECYGYVVQKLTTWAKVDPEPEGDSDRETRDEWEDTDESCWGFIGYEYAEQEARDALDYVIGESQ